MDAPALIEPCAAWCAALDRAAAASRTIVIGAADAGKSSFVLAAMAGQLRGLALLDLDPGQKMIGAPGTISLGRYDADARRLLLEAFVFVRTTSAARFGATTEAAEALAAGAGAFIANTAGFTTGPGTWLQVQTIAALKPDLIVAIGEGLEPILGAHPAVPAVRIARSPLAVRKSPSTRAAIRQAAFAYALAGASRFSLDATIGIEPGLPTPFVNAARPVCALADERGDMAICVLERCGGGELIVHAPAPPRPVRTIRLGSMWAESRAGGWALLDRLTPAWAC